MMSPKRLEEIKALVDEVILAPPDVIVNPHHPARLYHALKDTITEIEELQKKLVDTAEK